MSTRIKGLDGGSIGSSGSSPVEKSQPVKPTGGSDPQTAGSGDSVSLTDSALQLAALAQRLGASPEVDAARVASLQQAIDQGSYQPDPARIATRLLQLDQQLRAARAPAR